jgi:hypothetical protein
MAETESSVVRKRQGDASRYGRERDFVERYFSNQGMGGVCIKAVKGGEGEILLRDMLPTREGKEYCSSPTFLFDKRWMDTVCTPLTTVIYSSEKRCSRNSLFDNIKNVIDQYHRTGERGSAASSTNERGKLQLSSWSLLLLHVVLIDVLEKTMRALAK